MISEYSDLFIENKIHSSDIFSYSLYNFEGKQLYSEPSYNSLLDSNLKLKRAVERFIDYGNRHPNVSGLRRFKNDRSIQLMVRSENDRIYKVNFEINLKGNYILAHIESTVRNLSYSEKYRIQKFRSLKHDLVRTLKLEKTYFYLVNIEIYNHPFLHKYEAQIYEAVFLDLHAEFLTITNNQNVGFRISTNQIFFAYQINKPDVDINWIPSSLISYMKNTIQIENHEFHLKLSIGGLHTSETDTGPLNILKGLKTNLKKVIDSPFSRYATQNQDDSSNLIATYLSLRNSVHKKELLLYYQPIVNSETKNLHSLEALSRWNHSVKGMISPDIFIPLAEESGLISSIGAWVIQNALLDLSQIQKNESLSSNCLISINVSPFQLKNPEFADNLISYFSKLNFLPSSVVLEMTESRYEETILIIEQMAILKRFGFQIAIDDFGIGNSNFSRIEKIECDYVKLDKSLVIGVDTDSSKRRVLKAISQVLLSLGKKTVFEGIENAGLENIAIDYGANFLQGFYYGKPTQITDLSSFPFQL
ncbi:EAL domain-containing protein [Leptospira santarosai]|uniref:Diguanylate phosphodiesterase n=1 Tax=Leptospira santarosai serovar Shermani str. LT 821 TaxID=758847 RepID=K8Y6U7_9LEPT|nr:EAL domain-containing protein [Leptospira santarosai]EKT85485.1 diguanylate phosphodiesterase [Leptospira santarosai serovar Shermani str. LT 821]EPG80764.1 cyclic diguanylate phosphodiesterase (EAL) domain protein [Leptospira santarosai serovar Shermani str. 1342KT]